MTMTKVEDAGAIMAPGNGITMWEYVTGRFTITKLTFLLVFPVSNSLCRTCT